jgi:hypothetical protein
MSGTAEIIQLFGPRTKRGEKINTDRSLIPAPQCEEGVSDTAGNQRLRRDRRDVWREADAVMDYWHVSMKMDTAISRVQNFGTPEGDLRPVRNPAGHWALVGKYREAWVRLMLMSMSTLFDSYVCELFE